MATRDSAEIQQRVEALRRYYALAGPLIANALRARVEWLNALDEVIDEFDKRGTNAGRVKAGLVGAQYTSLFERYMQAFVRLQAPASAEDFHQRWLAWLQRLMRANFCLSEGASRSDFQLLEEACSTLEEARPLLAAITRVTSAIAPDLIPAGQIRGRPSLRAAPSGQPAPAAPPPAARPQPAPVPPPVERPPRPAPAKPAGREVPILGSSRVKVASKTVDPKQDSKLQKRPERQPGPPK